MLNRNKILDWLCVENEHDATGFRICVFVGMGVCMFHVAVAAIVNHEIAIVSLITGVILHTLFDWAGKRRLDLKEGGDGTI